VFDPETPPRSPAIAAALGLVRAAVTSVVGRPSAPRRLLVACSGGPDSIAALGLLMLLRRGEELELGVGHVDHGLRPESRDEAEAVAALARALALPSFHTRLELEAGPGIPARAREARRAALRDHAGRFGAAFIVLGHTATDQAETMLMHMTRGAGLDGLAAMPVVDGPWLRPLLELTRDRTRALASELELPFFDDPSNDDLAALRVRMREVVLPVLRDHNPRVEQAMLSLARQAADADQACQRWAEDEVAARGPDAGEAATLRWDLAGFDELPRAVRTRALRRMCEFAGADPGSLRARIIELIDAAAVAVARSGALRSGGGDTPSPRPRRWNLHPRVVVMIDKNGVHAHQTAPKRPTANH
jgi:tRNA(Ile)-lysidine synthase